MSIFPWRKKEEHHHCADAERDHTRERMIYLFGGSIVCVVAYGLATSQIHFTGEIDASSMWETMKFIAIGVFTWIIKDASDRRNSKPQGGESVQ
jgi:hypothetical protein